MTNRVPLTREQVRRVDQLAVSRYGIPSIILMENAGRNAAEIIGQRFGAVARQAFIVAGPGNNGGDGCVIARHLHNRGWGVALLLAGDGAQLTPDTSVNFRILEAMRLSIAIATELDAQRAILQGLEGGVLVDAVLGTGFAGTLRASTIGLIEAMNAAKKLATVAIDVPSGLDCNTGLEGGAVVCADATITFVAEKIGFSRGHAQRYLGVVEVADIGAPRGIVDEVLHDAAR